MRIGTMRHKVMVMHQTMQKNAVAERIEILEPMYGLRAAMNFENVQGSDSKFSKAWANRLVMQTRYSRTLMDTLNNKTDFKIEFQGNYYSIISYESWNHMQKYITLYLEKDI
ncbi:phage head completion protein [Aeromonas rivipollensis]|uniref:phage head completion protein n=1 Tax=Aeromonas rivipollensis TaxID=948519 RepID=UPI003B984810